MMRSYTTQDVLLDGGRRETPQAIILLGPFVDEDHPLIKVRQQLHHALYTRTHARTHTDMCQKGVVWCALVCLMRAALLQCVLGVDLHGS